MPTFGIMHDFRPRAGGDHRRHHAECLAEVALADELGIDTVWLSEHHLTPDGLTSAPLVLAAAVAARTSRILVGTNVLVLPLHHPLRVAEEAALVDIVSGGRLVLGVGQGYAPAEFAAFGVSLTDRARLLTEGVRVLRAALETGEVDGLPVTPSPLRRVPVNIAGVTPAGLRRAARLGDAVQVYCATPADLLARRAVLDTIDRDVPLVCTSVLHVAATAEQAWAEAGPGIAYLEGQISAYSGERAGPPPRREDYLVGTPDDVAIRLTELHRALRFTHFAHWARLPGLTHERALASLRLYATEVLDPVAALVGSGRGG
jgi:alkanesulfonate monooxygenase SsuD/methylene tetrahydromethanopterin reductase-like flavin-dependent oxidoreductase (luciferase family)